MWERIVVNKVPTVRVGWMNSLINQHLIDMAKKNTSPTVRKSATKSSVAKKRGTRSAAKKQTGPAKARKAASVRQVAKKIAQKAAPAKKKAAASKAPAAKTGKARVTGAAVAKKKRSTAVVGRTPAAERGSGAVKRTAPARKVRKAAPAKAVGTRAVKREKVTARPDISRWPQALHDPTERTPDPEVGAIDAQRRSFRERLLAEEAQVDRDPNELHRGRTGTAGPSHDRPGSQPERKRHQYPNGNRPNSGSARSTAGKGRRRDNMSQGG